MDNPVQGPTALPLPSGEGWAEGPHPGLRSRSRDEPDSLSPRERAGVRDLIQAPAPISSPLSVLGSLTLSHSQWEREWTTQSEDEPDSLSPRERAGVRDLIQACAPVSSPPSVLVPLTLSQWEREWTTQSGDKPHSLSPRERAGVRDLIQAPAPISSPLSVLGSLTLSLSQWAHRCPHLAGLPLGMEAFACFPAPLALKAVTSHRTPQSSPFWSKAAFLRAPAWGQGGLWSAATRRRFGFPAERADRPNAPFSTAPPQHVGKDQPIGRGNEEPSPGTSVMADRVGCLE